MDKTKGIIYRIICVLSILYIFIAILISFFYSIREFIITSTETVLSRSLDHSYWHSYLSPFSGWFVTSCAVVILVNCFAYYIFHYEKAGLIFEEIISKAYSYFKEHKISFVVAFIHWIVSFYTDTNIFIWHEGSNVRNYIVCKIITFIVLYIVWNSIIQHEAGTLKVLKYSAAYLIPLLLLIYNRIPIDSFSGDELNIYNAAIRLQDWLWFNYQTVWYYIISLMLVPSFLGPIIVKIIIQSLLCGYTVKRASDLFGWKYGVILYIPFFIIPVIDFSVSAHRIPVYYLIFTFVLIKMLFDKIENKSISRMNLIGLMFLISILTQWRTEGIYLVFIGLLLIFITYHDHCKNMRSILTTVVLFICIQYIVSVPQNGLFPGHLGGKANDRMGPFWAYTITNMLRNGLDINKNSDDIARIKRYLDIETINRLINDLGDECYRDVFIIDYDGYIAVKESSTHDDYISYTEGCKNIIINNPIVFLKSRIGAFEYTALSHKIGEYDGDVILYIRNIAGCFFYNLYIPHILLFFGWFIALIKRKWYVFFASTGVICNSLFVFILAPAAYFKYYLPVYFIVYLYTAILVVDAVYNVRNEDGIDVFV